MADYHCQFPYPNRRCIVTSGDEVVQAIKPRIRDAAQEERLRKLYERVTTAFQQARSQGVKAELEADWQKIKADFDSAVATVKKDTGLM